MEKFADVATLLVDGNKGIYIGKVWAVYIQSSDTYIRGIDRKDFNTLWKGPDEPDYIDVWEHVKEEVVMQDKEGNEHRLHENSEGLWLVPNDVEIDWSEISD